MDLVGGLLLEGRLPMFRCNEEGNGARTIRESEMCCRGIVAETHTLEPSSTSNMKMKDLSGIFETQLLPGEESELQVLVILPSILLQHC